MELAELETLLDAKLDPLKETISRLERTQEQMVTILANQARQDEAIKHNRTDLDKCMKVHDVVFSQIRALEAKDGDKLWDTIKIIAAAVLSGVVGAMASRGIKL